MLICIGLFCILSSVKAQRIFEPSDTLVAWRKTATITTASVSSIGVLGAVSYFWYQSEDFGKFRTFNDFSEWQGMDKLGHLTSAYHGATLMYTGLSWCGLPKSKASFYGSLYSFSFLLFTETLDGFSKGWGFSFPDVTANALGSGLQFVRNGYGVNWFDLKFSFHATDYAIIRPNLLGENNYERWLKDYNGQTYWLNLNIFNSQINKHLKPISLSIGYNAFGMIGGKENPQNDINGLPYPSFERRRQLLLSLDYNLAQIKTRYPILNTFFKTVGILKIPFPAIGFDGKNFNSYWLYY